MINKDTPMGKMMHTMPQVGEVVWIGVRPARREEMKSIKRVSASVETGLKGDRFNKKGKRQVTLIQFEHLLAVSTIMKMAVKPELVRRNIVVKGINLLALKDQRFQIGGAVLETTGSCHPCSRMEENLGEGGYNAMRGHGGITAIVIEDGIITVGDEVKLLDK